MILFTSRFFASPNMDVQFRLSVFRVNEADFRSCDLERGSPVAGGPQSDVFPVSEDYLLPGNNYFIGECSTQAPRTPEVRPRSGVCFGAFAGVELLAFGKFVESVVRSKRYICWNSNCERSFSFFHCVRMHARARVYECLRMSVCFL